MRPGYVTASKTAIPSVGAPRWAVFAWVRANLCPSWPNTLATVVLGGMLLWAGAKAVNWLWLDSVVRATGFEECARAKGACWAFIHAKYRLILFGPYPYAEQWRPTVALVLFLGLAAYTGWPAAWRSAWRRALLGGLWLVVLTSVGILMAGHVKRKPRVEARLWGGLPLTLLLALGGVFFAFWLAIVLALGRQSALPVIRWVSVGYIELIRGVPLIGLLFMATVLFPLIVPPHVDVDKLLRAQLAFVMFFAAYMAEAIRGGLQAIPRGQYEAADALGLGYWQRTRAVVLPQALRLAIPSLVNVFIGAFKDTSLVIVISMFDLIGAANAAKNDPVWWGLYVEAYLFVGAIYLAFCAAMPWYSQRIEARLGGARG